MVTRTMLVLAVICLFVIVVKSDEIIQYQNINNATRVNLIQPVFLGVKADCDRSTKTNDYRITCNMTVYTRASSYQLEVTLGDNTTMIYRASPWMNPVPVKELNDYYIERGEREPINVLTKRLISEREDYASKRILSNIMKGSELKLRCSALARVKKSTATYSFCQRDTTITICYENVSPCLYYHEENIIDKDDRHSYPITAMDVSEIEFSSPDKIARKILLIRLDLIGRVIFSIHDLKGQLTPKEFELYPKFPRYYVDLNSISGILNPNEKSNTFKADSSLINDDIKRLAESDTMKKIARRAFITSITPIHRSDPRAQNDLCYSAGFKGPDDLHPAVCLKKGAADKPPTRLNKILGDISIHGITIYERVINLEREGRSDTKKFSYLHIVYKLLTGPQRDKISYLRCRREGDFGWNRFENLPMNPDPSRPQDQDCKSSVVEVAPDAIVYYKPGGNCASVITFYSMLYQVFKLDDSLLTDKEFQIAEELTFYIMAAHSDGNKFIFFTYSNTMITIDAKFNSDRCSNLIFDKNTWKEYTSQDYFADFLKVPKTEPYIFDYREIESGSLDSQPPIIKKDRPDSSTLLPASSVGPFTTIDPNSTSSTILPSSTPSPDVKKGGNFNVIIISIVLIIGGLVLACIIYMCFLSGSSEKVAPGRSKRRPETPTSEMGGHKTIRSHIQSNIQPHRSSSQRSKQSRLGPSTGTGGGQSAQQISKGSKGNTKVIHLSSSKKSPTSMATNKVKSVSPTGSKIQTTPSRAGKPSVISSLPVFKRSPRSPMSPVRSKSPVVSPSAKSINASKK